MTYATGRRYLDADSHLMELPGWLEAYADPDVRPRIRPLALGGAGALAEAAVADAQRRGDDPRGRLDDADLLGRKGWHAAGAFDATERSQVLDQLGFDAQLVFSTFAPTQYLGDDVELVFGGTRAHNRAMADFCSQDSRLLAVAFVPWGPPELEHQAVVEALDLGCRAVHFPSKPARRAPAPSHPDHHPTWAALAERNVPFVV